MSRLPSAVVRPNSSPFSTVRHGDAAPVQRAWRSMEAAPFESGPDPWVDEALKLVLAVGVVVVLLLPGARGSVASIGWLPMWLLGMPLVALWALRGFPHPWGARAPEVAPASYRRRRLSPQARRRTRALPPPVRARAA